MSTPTSTAQEKLNFNLQRIKAAIETIDGLPTLLRQKGLLTEGRTKILAMNHAMACKLLECLQRLEQDPPEDEEFWSSVDLQFTGVTRQILHFRQKLNPESFDDGDELG